MLRLVKHRSYVVEGITSGEVPGSPAELAIRLCCFPARCYSAKIDLLFKQDHVDILPSQEQGQHRPTWSASNYTACRLPFPYAHPLLPSCRRNCRQRCRTTIARIAGPVATILIGSTSGTDHFTQAINVVASGRTNRLLQQDRAADPTLETHRK